jgi:DNA modification methylase
MASGGRMNCIDQVITDRYTAAHGDCVEVLRGLPDKCIGYSIFSPPFASLYIYSDDAQDMGNNASDAEFFQHYGFLIAEKLRITKPGCLSAVHCKNIVQYAGRDWMAGLRDFRGEIIKAHCLAGWAYHSEVVIWKDPVIEMQRTKAQGLLYKQLRQDSRFSRVGMPEYVLLFRKWGEGMKENPVAHNVDSFPLDDWQRVASPVWMDVNQTRVLNGQIARENQDEKHICPLQLDVIERLLKLYTNNGDMVYSPFMGIGSEGICAIRSGRKFKGSELKEAYWKHACKFLHQAESESVSLFDYVP